MFARMLTSRMIRKPGPLALALSGLMLLAPAPACAETAKDVVCDGCVDSSDIAVDTVSAADIGTGAVGSDEVANCAVAGAKGAANGPLVLFTAEDEVHGRELWATDGTAEGTRLVADINPNPPGFDWGACLAEFSFNYCNSLEFFCEEQAYGDYCRGHGNPNSFIAYAGKTYFVADDGTTGYELWRTNGHTVKRVTDLAPGAASSFEPILRGNSTPTSQHLIVYKDALYMRASDGHRGGVLFEQQFGVYRYTTAGGVEHVADLPGRREGVHGWFAILDETLYFAANRESDMSEDVYAYRPGGPPEGLGVPYDSQDGHIHDLTAIPDQALLFNARYQGRYRFWGFRADTGLNPIEFGPGSDEVLVYPVIFGDEVCAVITDSLWCSDGTPNARNVGPQGLSSGSDPLVVGGLLYFRAFLPSVDYKLWVTDGTRPAQTLGVDGFDLIEHVGELYYTCGSDSGNELCRWRDGAQQAFGPFWAGAKISIPGTSLIAYSCGNPYLRDDFQLCFFDSNTDEIERVILNPRASARPDQFYVVEDKDEDEDGEDE